MCETCGYRVESPTSHLKLTGSDEWNNDNYVPEE
jgi:hypothetical protein